MTTINH